MSRFNIYLNAIEPVYNKKFRNSTAFQCLTSFIDLDLLTKSFGVVFLNSTCDILLIDLIFNR